MQVFIVVSMCVINLILWIVFFSKFKSLFTTDDEIQKTRAQYNLLIHDINQNVADNIDLIDAKISELNDVIEIANRRLSAVNSEQEFSKNKKAAITKYNSGSSVDAGTKRRTSRVSNYARDVIDQDAAFEVNVNLKKGKKVQGELFEESSVPKRRSSIHVVDKEGNVYGEVPVVSPKIYMSDHPIKPKKNFQDAVKDLYDRGYTVEQISSELNKSMIEVQFVIDML
ncbi:hypothetical protein [Treponema sp.]|uniref:hypothetical protein n=1 Tax=Treponema sp. TaxID=166 RepID=UPI00389033B0